MASGYPRKINVYTTYKKKVKDRWGTQQDKWQVKKPFTLRREGKSSLEQQYPQHHKSCLPQTVVVNLKTAKVRAKMMKTTMV